jgi:hypothetical protein
MNEATYMPCNKDAHGDSFHHANQFVGSTPTAAALFVFHPPTDGCYTIEEWHPGSNENCNRYLLDSVRLEVTYGQDKRAYKYIEQPLNNGQWNMLGALPFKKAFTGYFMLKGSLAASCREGTNCFWAADAFKLTKISDPTATCTLPEQFLTFEQMLQVDSEHPQVIVDDSEVQTKDNWDTYRSIRIGGNPGVCGHQGWGNSFKYLTPQKSLNVAEPLKFVFKVPKDGCYLVEEFHPASVCSQKLTSSAQLSIKFGRNRTAMAAEDQTRGANQWNSVALLPFNVGGFEASITVQHPQVGTGVAVADAFRFTKVADTCPQAHPQVPQFLRLKEHPDSVTVDDSIAKIYEVFPRTITASVRHSWHHGCHKTAYLGTIHMANHSKASEIAVRQSTVAAVFDFVPPSTGCYRVDEFHPENWIGCYLGEASVRVDHCLGKSWQGNINLRRDGGQWNTVGHFPFYAGISGKVTSRPTAGSQAHEWVADAFRFTKVSDNCVTVPHSALVTLRLTGVNLTGVQLPDGKLTTNTDRRLAFHEAIVTHSGLHNSQVRLLGLRKGSIIAEFEFQGKEADVTGAVKRVQSALLQREHGKLQHRLCEAATVSIMGPKLWEVLSMGPKPCRVEMIRTTAVGGWSTAVTPEVDEIFPIWAQITIGCGTVVLSVMAAFICLCIRRRKHAKLRNEAQSLKGEKDAETTSKDVKDNISDSASTATPDRFNGGVQTDVSGDLFDLDDISISGPVHSSDAVSVGLGPVDSSSHGAKADV